MAEKGFMFRAYPNKNQQTQLAKTFGCVRFVYNHYLAKRIDLYKSEKKSMNYNACSADLTNLKQEKKWLKEIDKFALQNALKDLNKAYENFFREIKKGNKDQGFPKFKSKHNHEYKYRTSFTNGNIEIKNNKVKHVQQIDRYYPSSQLCNVCGYKNEEVKDLSIRIWECPECGSKHNRDVNAAINIRNEGLRLLSA